MRHPRYTDLRVKSLRGLSGLTCNINNLSFSLIMSRLVLFHVHFTQEKKTFFSAIIVTVCLGQCESSVKDIVTIVQMSKETSFQIFWRLMQ